jgi:tetratricopeptide (TPR) repeat protein
VGEGTSQALPGMKMLSKRNVKKKRRPFPVMAVLALVIALMDITAAHALIKTFIKEHSYQANELDSKTSCRAIAMDQVKRMLLEELGTYVKGRTTVKNHQLEDDEIMTLTAGVVQTKLLEERWDGKEYWLRAELRADPDEVASSIENLKSNEDLVRDLEEARAEAVQAMEEVGSLKQRIARMEADRETQEQYDEAIQRLAASDWFEKGTALSIAGDYEGAASAYDQVVLLKPDDAKTYVNRSIVYIQLGDYRRAANDLDRAASLNPSKSKVYVSRAERTRTHIEGGAASGDRSRSLVIKGETRPKERAAVRRLADEGKKERKGFQSLAERRIADPNRDMLKKKRELQRKKQVDEIRKKKDLKRKDRPQKGKEPGPEDRRKGRGD